MRAWYRFYHHQANPNYFPTNLTVDKKVKICNDHELLQSKYYENT